MRPAFQLTWDVFEYCLSFCTEKDLLLLFCTLKDGRSDDVKEWVSRVENYLLMYNPNISQDTVTAVALTKTLRQLALANDKRIPPLHPTFRDYLLRNFMNNHPPALIYSSEIRKYKWFIDSILSRNFLYDLNKATYCLYFLTLPYIPKEVFIKTPV